MKLIPFTEFFSVLSWMVLVIFPSSVFSSLILAPTKYVLANYPANKMLLMNEVPWDYLSHIVYSSATINQDGSITNPNVLNLSKLVTAAHSKGKKVVLSLNDSLGGKTFSNVLADVILSQALSSNIMSIINALKLDGIQIDWTSAGATQGDIDNYFTFLGVLKPSLGSFKTISVTVPGSVFPNFGLLSTNMNRFAAKVNWIQIFAMEMQPGVENSITAHSSPFASPSNGVAGVNTPSSFSNSFKVWEGAGIPSNQIILSVPLYGYGSIVDSPIPSDSKGNLYRLSTLTPSSPSIWTWSMIRAAAFPNGFSNGVVTPWIRTFDPVAQSYSLFNPETNTFITYDDPLVGKSKASLVLNSGALGISLWDMSLSLYETDYLSSISSTLYSCPIGTTSKIRRGLLEYRAFGKFNESLVRPSSPQQPRRGSRKKRQNIPSTILVSSMTTTDTTTTMNTIGLTGSTSTVTVIMTVDLPTTTTIGPMMTTNLPMMTTSLPKSLPLQGTTTQGVTTKTTSASVKSFVTTAILPIPSAPPSTPSTPSIPSTSTIPATPSSQSSTSSDLSSPSPVSTPSSLPPKSAPSSSPADPNQVYWQPRCLNSNGTPYTGTGFAAYFTVSVPTPTSIISSFNSGSSTDLFNQNSSTFLITGTLLLLVVAIGASITIFLRLRQINVMKDQIGIRKALMKAKPSISNQNTKGHQKDGRVLRSPTSGGQSSYSPSKSQTTGNTSNQSLISHVNVKHRPLPNKESTQRIGPSSLPPLQSSPLPSNSPANRVAPSLSAYGPKFIPTTKAQGSPKVQRGPIPFSSQTQPTIQQRRGSLIPSRDSGPSLDTSSKNMDVSQTPEANQSMGYRNNKESTQNIEGSQSTEGSKVMESRQNVEVSQIMEEDESGTDNTISRRFSQSSSLIPNYLME